VPGLQRFQVVQKSLDSLDITLVRGPGFADSGLDYIRHEIAKVLGDAITVNFRFVEQIPVAANGKFRVTICELPAQDRQVSP
jgi:phenylacetate-CoA ligase